MSSGGATEKAGGAVNIVFATTIKDRSGHLAQTLPRNLAGNPRSRFVILDYGSTEKLPTAVNDERVSLYRYEASTFHMTHAKNMAHRLGMLEGADVLVNLDADNYLQNGFEDFVEGAMAAKGDSDLFLWARLIKGERMKFKRGTSGRIGVTPATFVKLGGYDERFDTWAPDDRDLVARLRYLKYRPVEIAMHYLESIPHGDGVRFREYPHVREEAIYEPGFMQLPPVRTAVVNYGQIGCGLVNGADGSNVDLKPIPTRIFGIGLHKTATTSLDAAFKILGYDSAHWGNDGWARDVWNEMRANKISPALERYYAASDLPIPLLYKELDRAYPGSKFILTMRDEIDWLRSVRDHFSYEHNPFRSGWDVYPFTNKLHEIIYGRTDFEAVRFLERYRRHNAEVMEYFKNRPDDLLVMREHDWPELCAFLGKPVPDCAYPRKFVTAKPSDWQI